MTEVKQAVIFCGGIGSRLGTITKQFPKPMIDVCGKPFLEHLLIQLKKNGIYQILLLVGFKSEIIQNYFGNGKKLNLKISYSYMPKETGTGSRLFEVRKKLKKKFILLYSDNYTSLNIHKLNSKFEKLKKGILLSLVKKKKGNCIIDKKTELVLYKAKRSSKNNYVEIGYMIISKKILYHLKNSDTNFSNFLKKVSNKGLVSGTLLQNGYTSIGDKKRLNLTRKLFLNNNYLLVDRDGVLNISPKKRYVTDLTELKINKNLCNKLPDFSNLICITNQAGISTGELTLKNLNIINLNIKKYLQKRNKNIKEFFVSNHHYNSNSFLRKPNPGMFYNASIKYNFILDKTFYIGDDIRDIEAAYNANTFIIYIGKKKLTHREKIKYKFILLKKNIKKLYNEKIKNDF